jgi:AraC-like DNA-binding protein
MRVVPTVQVAGRFPIDDRAFAFTYRHPTHALHLYEYSGRIRMRGQEIALEPGDVTMSVAGLPTQYDLPEAGYHWCVHFHKVRDQADRVSLPVHMRLPGRRHHLADRIAEVARLVRDPTRSGAHVRAGLVLQDLLLQLAESPSLVKPKGRASDAVAGLLTVMDQRFAEVWTVPQLAALVGVTQDALSRRFRERTGMTIPRYLLQRRIAHAQHLLEITDLPVKRIAERVGMPDAQHFNKQFRLVTGLSPTAARAIGCAHGSGTTAASIS